MIIVLHSSRPNGAFMRSVATDKTGFPSVGLAQMGFRPGISAVRSRPLSNSAADVMHRLEASVDEETSLCRYNRINAGLVQRMITVVVPIETMPNAVG